MMIAGAKMWVAIGVATVAAGAGSFLGVRQLTHGGDSGNRTRVDASRGEAPLVIRALGDSVTAAFGYSSDGQQISAGDLPYCVGGPDTPDCQDPDGVAYPAVFASKHPGSDFKNLAQSGSTPADWLGQGKALGATLADVVNADPDLTVLTLGANPLLSSFLAPGSDRICATSLLTSVARACVRGALAREQVVSRLTRVYLTLLHTPPRGRNGLVVVFQYPETHPPSAYGARVSVLIAELGAAIERAADATRQAAPAEAHRLLVIDPGPFLQHGCTSSAPWILRVDTCIHPNAAGHRQLADVLERTYEGHRPRELPAPQAETAPTQFASPGTSCGIDSVSNARSPVTRYPNDTIEARLGVTQGRLPCTLVDGLFESYATDASPCEHQGAGTCTQTVQGWLCSGETEALFPMIFACHPSERDWRNSTPPVVGLLVEETTPQTDDSSCSNANQGGGPFGITANFDCRAAERIASAISADPGDNYGFLCKSSQTSFESEQTECSLDSDRLQWTNGA